MAAHNLAFSPMSAVVDFQAELDAQRDRMNSVIAPHPNRRRKKFILCFDGTGNKFSGTDADCEQTPKTPVAQTMKCLVSL